MTHHDSILHRMAAQGRPAPRVRLKGSEHHDSGAERYAILGELARGGTGVVHKGRDNDLGRDVALKVLREDHLGSRELIERFVEEAQIGGQLQHPGIVPVYELGLRSDRRPYFAMKLVKGETLAARFAARADPATGRRALLAVYREVCRTMAYAHARGVIHRDLKPSNVMIGSFGEVQIVDWGFAKVVRRGGVADEELADKRQRDVTMISTVRSGAGSSHSVAGSVMGTPGYMSPEQAMGRTGDLDERSDLFGLGAILCELLTGEPPYTGSRHDRMNAAAQARLGPAQARLDGSGADPRLVTLCKRCLAALPQDRPSSAQQIADEVASYLQDAEDRAHRAQLRALRARDQAAAQRRARRLATYGGLAAAAALLIAACTWLWLEHEATQRERETQDGIQASLQDAERLRAAGQWSRALAAAERARLLGDDSGIEAAIRREAQAVRERQRRDAEDKALLDDLEGIRTRRGHEFDDAQAEAAFVAAIESRWPDFAVDTRRLSRSPYALDFAAVFDAWALMRRTGVQLEGSDWQQIDRLARALDPDRDELRDAFAAEDPAALVELAASEQARDLPPALQATIAEALRIAGRKDLGAALLQQAHRRHPQDVWIHYLLGVGAERRESFAAAVSHFTAALALRPRSVELRHRLGIALESSGDPERAIAVWREALRLQPGWHHGYAHLAPLLVELGREQEAARAFRAGLQGDPDSVTLLFEYAMFVNRHGGRAAEAADYLRRAAAATPDEPNVRLHLGNMLAMANDHAGAVVAFEACLARSPSPHVAARAHAGLATSLWRTGRREAAAAAIRVAEQQAGDDGWVWCDIGAYHEARQDLDRALAAFDRALADQPAMSSAHTNRGYVLLQRGRGDDHEAALRAFERAAALGDDSFLFHARFGALLADHLGRPAEAVAHFRRAHEIDPDRWEPCQSLGLTLAREGERDEGAEWLERAVAVLPGDAEADLLVSLGGNFELARRPERALQLYDEAVARSPQHVGAHVSRAWLLFGLGRHDAALAAAGRAVASGPGSWRAHTTLGSLLLATGRPDRAVAPFRRAIELNPQLAGMHVNLGAALANLGDPEAGRRKFRDALALDPDHARAHYNLAYVAWQLDEPGPALATFARALELDPTMAGGYPDLIALQDLHDRLPAVLAGQQEPADETEAAALARLAILVDRDPTGAVRLLQEQLGRLEPRVAEQPGRVARFLRALQCDACFASIRDADAGAAPRRFWAEVEALRRRAEAAGR